MIWKKYKILKALHFCSIVEMQKKIEKSIKNKLALPLSVTAAIAVFIFQLTKDSVQVDISVCMWGLACIWLYFATVSTYSCVVAWRYRGLYQPKKS